MIREGTGWIRGKRGTERFFNIEADRALRASARLLAGRRVGSVGTTSGHDSIRRPLASLPRSRWGNVIVRATMLVVSDEDDGVLPERTIANRVHHLRNERLASLDIGGRMLVILELDAEQTKVRINKRY